MPHFIFTGLYMIGHRPHGARLYVTLAVVGVLLLVYVYRRTRR